MALSKKSRDLLVTAAIAVAAVVVVNRTGIAKKS